MVRYLRGTGLSFISVITAFIIIELFEQGLSFSVNNSTLFAIIPLIFLILYSVCFLTELIVSWAEFKFYNKYVALGISLGMGILLAFITPFAFVGAIFFYIGRTLEIGTKTNTAIIISPLFLLIFNIILVRQ